MRRPRIAKPRPLLLLALLLRTSEQQQATAAVATITFKNQCSVQVDIFDGDEHFCDVPSGSKADPRFGCATNLPLGYVEYSHTRAANATRARFHIDEATNNTFYELSDQREDANATTGFNVALMIYPMLFRDESVGFTTCSDVWCLHDGCPDAYHDSNDTTGKTFGCPGGADFVLIFCP